MTFEGEKVETLEAIRSRRSVRKFKALLPSEELVKKVLEAGIWAPSGMNNQPWAFVLVKDKTVREELSKLTLYSDIILSAPLCIAVFLDHRKSYDYVKDVQSTGACIQNMLLAAHDLGLGAVWLGEILKNKEAVRKLLKVPQDCELMAVVALGYPDEAPPSGKRRPLESFLIGTF